MLRALLLSESPLAFCVERHCIQPWFSPRQKLKIIQGRIPGLCCRGRLYQAKASTASPGQAAIRQPGSQPRRHRPPPSWGPGRTAAPRQALGRACLVGSVVPPWLLSTAGSKHPFPPTLKLFLLSGRPSSPRSLGRPGGATGDVPAVSAGAMPWAGGACGESGGLWESFSRLEGFSREPSVSAVCWAMGWGSCPLNTFGGGGNSWAGWSPPAGHGGRSAQLEEIPGLPQEKLGTSMTFVGVFELPVGKGDS